MHARSLTLCTVAIVSLALVPNVATAQLDDFLEPLTPSEPEPKKKKPAPKRAAPKRKKAKKAPAPKEDLFAEPLVRSGKLLVRVVGPEDGATVTVDGKSIPVGKQVELDAGAYEVAVTRPGWSGFSRMVNVEAGKQLVLPVALEAVAGVLEVTSDVGGSQVLLGGKVIGSAPLSGHVVPPGMHEVIVRREGFEDHVSRLAIRAGRDYQVAASLRPLDGDRPLASRLVPETTTESGLPLHVQDDTVGSSPQWYQRWYVWAGAAAVAAAVTGAVVVANNNAGTTFPSPSDVCRGDCDAVMNPPAPSAVGRF